MAITRNHLSAREHFRVSNYLIEHLEELRAMPNFEARAAHVGAVLGITVTVPNLAYAAQAADVSLAPLVKTKPAPGGAMAELLRGLFERVEALEAAQEKTNALIAPLLTISVPINPTYAHTMGDADAPTRAAQHVPTGAAVQPAPGMTFRTTLL